MNYEALMCLTNLASLDDEHRRRIYKEKVGSNKIYGFWILYQYMHDIENYMLEEHWELRQAATELMCNMSVYSETIKWFEDEKYDRLKVSTDRWSNPRPQMFR